MNEILTVASVTAIVSVLFTLAFQYFPKLKDVWASVGSEAKRIIVLALYLVVGALIAFGGCLDILAQLIPQLLCTDAMTFGQYAIAVVFAIGAGQGVFQLLPGKTSK